MCNPTDIIFAVDISAIDGVYGTRPYFWFRFDLDFGAGPGVYHPADRHNSP